MRFVSHVGLNVIPCNERHIKRRKTNSIHQHSHCSESRTLVMLRFQHGLFTTHFVGWNGKSLE